MDWVLDKKGKHLITQKDAGNWKSNKKAQSRRAHSSKDYSHVYVFTHVRTKKEKAKQYDVISGNPWMAEMWHF